MKGRTIKRTDKAGKPSGEMPVSLFLKKEMVATAEKAVVYDLAKEFSATRKNRGLMTYISLALFTLFLLGGTFGVTSFIDRSNRNIAIDITDFEDINMQELLNSLRNAGKLMADMKQNMEQMKGQMGVEMQKVRMEAREELLRLKNQHNITQAQRAAMMRKVQADREKRIAEINAEYEARLKDKEKSIQEVKVQMSGYETRLQKKMDIYTEKLEKKLKQYQRESHASSVNAGMMVQQMGVDHARKRLEEKKQYEKELRELAEKVKKTETALKTMSGRADAMESLLGLYRRSLMHYAFMRGEQGHVISVQKDGGLLVVLNPLVELNKPCRGLVINRKGTVIAKVSIAPKGGMAHASVTRKMANVPVSPFDMIIVEK